jgi:exopolysaccharide biosynthesis polyprenyl glycosylphosphotransferase
MSRDDWSIELPDQHQSQIHWQGETAYVHRAVVTDMLGLTGGHSRPNSIAKKRSGGPFQLTRRVRVSIAPSAPNTSGQDASAHGIVPRTLDQRQSDSREKADRSPLSHDNVLSKHQFLKQLRLEKRRTERSKAPLSLVFFRVDTQSTDELGDVNALLKAVHRCKRETDVLGYLAEDLIALLLFDTDEQGTQVFMQKIGGRARELKFTMIAVTYPNRLFSLLLSKRPEAEGADPIFLGDPEPGHFGSFCKRTLDIVGSIVGMIVFLPLMLVIAAMIKITSPGPVIFKQIRLGKGGTPFTFYKFRSMSSNVDDRIHRDYVASLIKGKHAEINQGGAAQPLYKIKSDPRVTRVGRIIRKASIDELPQFFNVLKGDMSLVGPRPPIPYEAEKYEPWHLRRILEIKPGITGLWQVEGRSKTSFDDMVRLDLRYIRKCSLLLDIKILIRTVMVVIRGSGAT